MTLRTILRLTSVTGALVTVAGFSQTPAVRSVVPFPWEAPPIGVISMLLVLGVPVMLGSYAFALDITHPPDDIPET